MSTTTKKALKPIKRSRLHEKIVSQIIDLIHNGKLQDGDLLPPERELTDIFKVSRHTVREAIRTLESEKILRSRQGSGTYVIKDEALSKHVDGVISASDDTLLEVFQFRKLIEPQIAFLAAQTATAEDISHLEQLIQQQMQESGFAKLSAIDSRFHLAIAKATKNSILLRIVQDINHVLKVSRDAPTQMKTRTAASIAGHNRILAAIKNGDPQVAQKAMADHIIGIEELL